MSDLPLPEFSRRIFLSRSLQALGAAAALPLAAQALSSPEVARPGAATLKVLTPGEYSVLTAVADTLIPRGGAFDLGASDVDLARRIDGYLPGMHPDVVTGFRGALGFVEQQAPALAQKAGAFTALAEGDRDAVFAAMIAAAGLPASVLLALKFLCVSHFYTMDATWKVTGYDGPMLLEDRK